MLFFFTCSFIFVLESIHIHRVNFSFLSILYGGLNDSLPCFQHCIIPDLFFSPTMYAAIFSSFSNTWKPSQPLFLFKHVPCYSVRSLFVKISMLPETYMLYYFSIFVLLFILFSLKLIVREKTSVKL